MSALARPWPGQGLWPHRALYLFVLPFTALTVLFGLWPIVESVRVAFTDSSTALSDHPAYVGLDNFATILADPAFHNSIWLTALFTAASVALNVGVAVLLALLLSHKLLAGGRTLFKLAIFLPVIVPDVAGFIVWKWMFNQNFGVVNHALALIGLPAFAGLTRPGSAFATLILVELWHHVGLYTIIFLTNLQLLDPSLDEAAQIDGAGRLSRLYYVVIPQLRPAITINTVYALIEFLKTFTVAFVITRGGPNFSTDFISYYAWVQFNTAQYGEAAAVATLLFAAVATLAIVTYRLLDRSAEA